MILMSTDESLLSCVLCATRCVCCGLTFPKKGEKPVLKGDAKPAATADKPADKPAAQSADKPAVALPCVQAEKAPALPSPTASCAVDADGFITPRTLTEGEEGQPLLLLQLPQAVEQAAQGAASEVAGCA